MGFEEKIAASKTYLALAKVLHNNLTLKRDDLLALEDGIGVWHFYPTQSVSARLDKYHFHKISRRVAISCKERARAFQKNKFPEQLLELKLKNLDLVARLERSKDIAVSETRDVIKKEREIHKKVKASAAEKIRLFSNYSHDLKTPLSMIAIPLQQLVLEEEKLPVKLRLKLEQIKMAVYSVLRTVSHSLDAARLVVRKQKPVLQPYDLSDFAMRVCEVYAVVFESYGIAVEFDLTPDTIVEIDAMQFEKVINNLLSNALKYSLPGGTVHITLKPFERSAVFSITDSGLPMREKPRSQSVRASWTFSSHGYGLEIVKELVRLNRGKLRFIRSRNAGTTVQVELPHTPELKRAADAVRPHNFNTTMREVELIAAERTLLSRRKKERAP